MARPTDDRFDGSDDQHPPEAGGSTAADAGVNAAESGGDEGGGDGAKKTSAGTRGPTPLTQQVGRIVIVVLAVLFGVFAVGNSQSVDFSWIVGGTQVASDGSGGVPLIILLVAAGVIGALLGALIEWQFLRGRRARRDRD